MKYLIGFVIVCVVMAGSIGLWLLGSYNGMVSGNEIVNASWANVETQYQRRFDLVPNLVGATKGFLKQEQTVFGAIAEARTRYAGAPQGANNERIGAMNQYEGALSRLLVVMENYPELKSIQAVTTLTDELAGTENRIAVARDRYNEQVKSWNVSVKSFPRNLIAGIFGFEAKALFEADKEASTAPKVEL